MVEDLLSIMLHTNLCSHNEERRDDQHSRNLGSGPTKAYEMQQPRGFSRRQHGLEPKNRASVKETYGRGSLLTEQTVIHQ